MALQSSGAIKLSEVQTEFGGSNPISMSEYYGADTGVPGSGTISLSDFYGTSNAPTLGQSFGGGIYVGDYNTSNNNYRLIAAPANSTGTLASRQFSSTNSSTAGSTSFRSIEDGWYNTYIALTASNFSAASYARGLTLNGYDDWYIPSMMELITAYWNCKPTTDANYTYFIGFGPSNLYNGSTSNSIPSRPAYSSTSPTQTTATILQSGGSEAFPTSSNVMGSSQEQVSSTNNTFVALSFNNGYGSMLSATSSTYMRLFRKVQF